MKSKFQIIGLNLRAFSKAIRLFSKISNELLLTVDTNSMRLQAINDQKTGFVEIQFEKTFFDLYECNVETKCKLFLKSLILVFRVLNMDRTVDICTIIMDQSMPKVVFEMDCKNGVNREYFLPYMESSCLRYHSDLNQTNVSFKAISKAFSECLHNFSAETKDISIWLHSDKVLFKSYSDEAEEQNIITSFVYKSREFQNYVFTQLISVTFSLKDLKSFLEFASFHDQSIECYFKSSGKPIQFILTTDKSYSAKLILATHDFPENENPVPPTQADLNQQSQSRHSLSLIGTADLSVEEMDTTNQNPNVGHSLNTSQVPFIQSNLECLINTSVSNNISTNSSVDQSTNNSVNQSTYNSTISSNPNSNTKAMERNANNDRNDTEEDAFGDDDIIEQMLSQMPDLSHDFSDETNSGFTLTGPELYQYHMSVLHPNEEDDNPIMLSQDVLVSESDDEQ